VADVLADDVEAAVSATTPQMSANARSAPPLFLVIVRVLPSCR
jgi:hypothetical protein